MTSSKKNLRYDVAIVGAGVIGVSCARELVARGRRVVLIDRGQPGSGCSQGNAGFICPSHVVPLAAPGVLGNVFKWMLRSDSPFYLRPSMLPSLAGWLLQFARHCNPDHVRASIAPLLELLARSRDIYDQHAAQTNDFGYERRGILKLFKTEAGLSACLAEAEWVRQSGQTAEALDPQGLKRVLPDTSHRAIGGILYSGDGHLDPAAYVRREAAGLSKMGVELVTDRRIDTVHGRGSRIEALGDIQADRFVLAAGAWTPELARRAGWQMSLVPAKGYSLTFSRPAGSLNIPLLLAEAKVAVTPLPGRLRYAGTLELTGFDDSLNARRIAAIARAVPNYLPDIPKPDLAQAEAWCGFRPCTPDGLPMIGRLPGSENLYTACGHAMIGMASGPGTGLLLAQMMTGEATFTDPSPFRPERYCRRV